MILEPWCGQDIFCSAKGTLRERDRALIALLNQLKLTSFFCLA
jgi:hypothetical protein